MRFALLVVVLVSCATEQAAVTPSEAKPAPSAYADLAQAVDAATSKGDAAELLALRAKILERWLEQAAQRPHDDMPQPPARLARIAISEPMNGSSWEMNDEAMHLFLGTVWARSEALSRAPPSDGLVADTLPMSCEGIAFRVRGETERCKAQAALLEQRFPGFARSDEYRVTGSEPASITYELRKLAQQLGERAPGWAQLTVTARELASKGGALRLTLKAADVTSEACVDVQKNLQRTTESITASGESRFTREYKLECMKSVKEVDRGDVQLEIEAQTALEVHPGDTLVLAFEPAKASVKKVRGISQVRVPGALLVSVTDAHNVQYYVAGLDLRRFKAPAAPPASPPAQQPVRSASDEHL